jgi:hypothetical protein
MGMRRVEKLAVPLTPSTCKLLLLLLLLQQLFLLLLLLLLLMLMLMLFLMLFLMLLLLLEKKRSMMLRVMMLVLVMQTQHGNLRTPPPTTTTLSILRTRCRRLQDRRPSTVAMRAAHCALVPMVRCAFLTEVYTRGCHWFPRLLRLKRAGV